MRKLPLVASLVVLSGCELCEPVTEVLDEKGAEIYADVCRTPQKQVNGVLIGGTEDCDVGLGNRDISVKLEQKVRLTNPTQIELQIFEVALEGDPTFELISFPESIAPGFSAEVVMHVRPTTETTINTVLQITSNATNLDDPEDGRPVLSIPISLTGVDNGIPEIEVNPTSCNFDRVGIGGVQLCPVVVKNVGSRELLLDSVDFIAVDEAEPDTLFQVPPESTLTPFAFTGRPPSDDEPLLPGTEVTLSVRFTPDTLGNYQGRFRIESSDPDNSVIDVALSGIGVTPPECIIKVKSVNGVAVADGALPEIEPLDNVVLSIEESSASTPQGSIVAQQWVIDSRPGGSGVVLTNENLAEVGFTFDNGTDVGVDVAGEYCLSAQITDDIGIENVNECTLCFDAIPKDNFLVQLSWDTDEDDIDLHVTKQGSDGRYCVTSFSGSGPGADDLSESCSNSMDCNYAGCNPGESRPNWDGVAGTEGDPVLDIDDVNGFGPENINVDAMTAGNYLIGVNAYSVRGDSPVSGSTVRIFIFGRLAGELFIEQESTDWEDIAMVRWPDGVTTTRPCVEDLLDGDFTDELTECDAVEAADD